MHNTTYIVKPISYNSECINLTEWVSLFTICLAPLIAHVVSGTPQVSYLTHSRPKWYDYLCLYNPTSIIWRYAAITDRRIRAVYWSRHDLAPTNALFWTAKGFDGGENMVSEAAANCLRYPDSTHVQLLSVTMLKTIITTVQGVSALHILIGGFAGVKNLGIAGSFALDMLFYPLAILGLFRLCAATWLTEDFDYQVYTSRRMSMNKHQDDRDVDDFMETYSTLDPFLTSPLKSVGFISPKSSWPSWVFRFCYLAILGGFWLISVLNIVAIIETPNSTITTFLLGVFMFISVTISMIIYAVYFFNGMITTTIIPCISRIWYKLYTLFFIGWMFIVVVVASIETNRTIDGLYSSTPSSIRLGCDPTWWHMPSGSGWMGIASSTELRNYTSQRVVGTRATNVTSADKYWLYDLTGVCGGQIIDPTKPGR